MPQHQIAMCPQNTIQLGCEMATWTRWHQSLLNAQQAVMQELQVNQDSSCWHVSRPQAKNDQSQHPHLARTRPDTSGRTAVAEASSLLLAVTQVALPRFRTWGKSASLSLRDMGMSCAICR